MNQRADERVDVLLGLPSYDGRWPIQTSRSIEQAMGFCLANNVKCKRAQVIGNPYIQMARQELAERALATKVPWLCFIDDDMVFQPDAIIRLMNTAHRLKASIVGGIYFRRRAPYDCTAVPLGEEGKDTCLDKWEKDEVMKVALTGTGLLLIETAIFARLQKPWFNLQWDDKKEAFTIGEDAYFCLKAGRAGIPTYLDTGVQAGHLGDHVYFEGDYRWWQELKQMKAEKDIAAAAKSDVEVITPRIEIVK